MSRIRRLRPYVGLWCLVLLFECFFMRSVFHAGFSTTTIGTQIDAPVYIWSNAWVAHALFLFHNPFLANVSSVGHPFNLLANASNAGFAILCSPLTKLVGPVATFNVQLMAIPLLNGTAMVACARRLRAGGLVSVAAGLLWALNPFIVHSLLYGWTDVAYQVSLPLAVTLVIMTFRDADLTPRAGLLLLAGVIIFQFLVSQETLFDDVLFVGVIAVTLLVRRQFRITSALGRRDLFRYLVTPLAVFLLPLTLYALFGTSSLSNVRVPNGLTGRDQMLGMLWRPFHFGLTPSVINPYYVGVLFCAIFLWATWRSRQQSLIVAVAVATSVCWFFSMHYRSIAGVPLDRLIKALPIVGNLAVVRLIIQFWFGALIVIVSCTVEIRRASYGRGEQRAGVMALGGATLVSALLGVLLLRPPLAMGYPTDVALEHIVHSPGTHVVATFPFPYEHRLMMQQAETGEFWYHLGDVYTYAIYGQFPALQRDSAIFSKIRFDSLRIAPSRSRIELGHIVLQQLGVTDVVAPIGVTPSIGPGAQTDPITNEFVEYFTEMLGMPSAVNGDWVWRHIRQSRHPIAVLTTSQWRACGQLTVPSRIPRCVRRGF